MVFLRPQRLGVRRAPHRARGRDDRRAHVGRRDRPRRGVPSADERARRLAARGPDRRRGPRGRRSTPRGASSPRRPATRPPAFERLARGPGSAGQSSEMITFFLARAPGASGAAGGARPRARSASTSCRSRAPRVGGAREAEGAVVDPKIWAGPLPGAGSATGGDRLPPTATVGQIVTPSFSSMTRSSSIFDSV